MLKLIIFDLDGTLADTAQDITDAINYAVRPATGREYSVDEAKAMVGSGISKLLKQLISDMPDPGTYGKDAGDLVVQRFIDYYGEHLLDNTKAYPHVPETLSRLDHYIKAIVSNKREAYSKRVLEGIGILKYFDSVLGSDSVMEKKPSPAPVFQLLNRYSLEREEAMIVGDSNFDVETGIAAGIKVVGVTYGFRSRESLKGADFLIDSFDGLLEVIPKINESSQ